MPDSFSPPPPWGRVGRGKPRLAAQQSSLASPTPTLPRLGGGGFVRLVLLALLLSGCSATPNRETAPEPEGFWTGPMGGPVPATIEGGTVIDTEELAELIAEQDPVLVDVGPQPHKPDTIAPEAWVPPPHRTLPGSVWLPGAGAGELAPARDAWYRDALQRLTGGNLAKPLVIFCHPDCWGSWNAAKRAILYGYTDVHWYEEGIEGWQDAGHETQAVQPELPPQ